MRIELVEERMAVSSLVGSLVDSSEAVDVELSLERLQFPGLAEVFLHDFTCKSIVVDDLERFASWLPGDDVIEAKRVGIL